jgi:hypothetical protein
MRNLIYTLLLVLMGGEIVSATHNNIADFVKERIELERIHNVIVLPIVEDLDGVGHEPSKSNRFDFVGDVNDLFQVFKSLKNALGEYKIKEAQDFQKFSPKSKERFKIDSQKIYFLQDVVILYEKYGFAEKMECFKKGVDELLGLLEANSPYVKRRAQG